MSSLPPLLRAALERRVALHDLSQLKAQTGDISQHYRARGISRQVIGDGAAAVAYALSRMPGTYAAVDAVLGELAARAPVFAPVSVFDAGCGPGTAALAARDRFDSLPTVTLFDHNRQFLDLAAEFEREVGHVASRVLQGDLSRLPDGTDDLVLCSYALTELSVEAMLAVARALWARTRGVLVLVEPGRPADFERLLVVRRALIEAGASLLAPCPQDGNCPLVAPDWCHFVCRFDRSRSQRQVKAGSLGYEDEKFSYLILARPGIGEAASARVIKPRSESKFEVRLALCTPTGAETRIVSSRDRAAFKAAKKRDWGDAIEAVSSEPE